MENNGYQQYVEQSVNTMTPNELLLLLYDELVKRLGRCELALNKQNYVLLDESVDRSLAILRYLDDTLDMQYDVSRQLHRLYDFFSYELNRVKMGRNAAELAKIRPMLVDLRDTFHEADRLSRTEAKAGQA